MSKHDPDVTPSHVPRILTSERVLLIDHVVNNEPVTRADFEQALPFIDIKQQLWVLTACGILETSTQDGEEIIQTTQATNEILDLQYSIEQHLDEPSP